MSGPQAFEHILLSVTEGVATLTLNRAEVLNAASPGMIRDLLRAMDHIEEPDSGVRCLLLTGAGRAFCAGADLRPGVSGADNTGRHDAGFDLELYYHRFVRRLRDLAMPLITAVNGPAVGVGASIALMGDLVLCARSAYFMLAFRNIGLVPDGGATWLLPRLVGRARAMEMALLGQKITAETALAWGMINRAYDDGALLDEAGTIARELAQGPTVALGLTRQLFWASESNSHEQQLDLERRYQRQAGESRDFGEGMLAFKERRAPRFNGR
jgi:2-(1,2-epoxy-1,2-dihydrophenyl)acetyl-CoA isomerase